MSKSSVNKSKLNSIVSVLDFGAVGDNSTDDYSAFQQAIDNVASAGGGTVQCVGGKTYRLTAGPIVKDKVLLDLNGATLRLTLVGTGGYDYGVRVRNYASVINGTISVESSGTVGSQAGIHAAIDIGPMYGDGGTVASPSAEEGVTGWTLRNLKLSTNRDGKVAIQVIGGANNGLIDNIEVPSSSTCAGAVHLDWGFVGNISSSDVPTSRANFNAGTAYTTHPNNIIIRNIKIGSLSRTKSGVDTGSDLVRLSGVYNVTVQNINAVQCTYAAVRVTSGDLGFEFALAAVKPLGMLGIRWDNIAVQNTTDGWLIYCDSLADNVAAAVSGVGYSPLMAPLMETDLVVNQVTGKGSGGASASPGLYVIQIKGAVYTNINATGYSHGCLVDEQVFNVQIHGRFYANRGHGIYIHHGTFKPQDVLVMSGTSCYQNGQDAGFSNPAGICVEGSVRCRVDGAQLGHRTAASETTQSYGLFLSTVTKATDFEAENCHAFSVKAGGTAYLLLGTLDYGLVRLFRNNSVESAIATKIGGVAIIPINRFMGTDGVDRAHHTASRTILTADITPTAGSWVTGDVIFYSNPPAGKTGTRCETAGSPGTWAQF